jgi:hypothetical protein
VRRDAILRETWRDIVTGTARTATFALVFGFLVLAVVAADQAQVRRLVDEASEYREAGASILTLTAEGRIQGTACEDLATVPGVRAAGALAQEEEGLRVSTLPQSPMTLYSVTPGFPDVLGAETDGNGIVLSADAATSAGRAAGQSLPTTEGTTRVAGSYPYPPDGRRVGFGYAALDVTSSERLFDECWVDAWPLDDRLQPLLLTAVQPRADADADVQFSRLNTTLGTSFDGARAFEERLTSMVWAAGAVGALVVGFVSVRIRRVAIASALHTRVPRGSLAAILALETAAWVVPVAIVAVGATSVFAATAVGADRETTLLLTGRVLAPGVVSAFAGAALAFVTTRERHLFRYVKDR